MYFTREKNGRGEAVMFWLLVVLFLSTARQLNGLAAEDLRQTDDGNTTRKVTYISDDANITTIAPNTAAVCSFSFENNSVKTLRRFMDKGAIFVYLKLEIIDEEFEDPLSAYVEDTGDIFDPLMWVWAKGGKGQLLLASPSDFEVISLSTLRYGVYSLQVRIQPTNACNNITTTGAEFLQTIAELLQDIVKQAHMHGTAQTDDGDEDEFICLGKQNPQWFFDLSLSEAILQGMGLHERFTFDCWTNGGNKPIPVHNHSLNILLFVFGFILTLYSPLALVFIQTSPPEKNDKEEEILSLESDLPLGLKYWACSCGLTLYVFLFMLIQYIPIFCYLASDEAGYIRLNANDTVYTVYHILLNLVFLISVLVLGYKFGIASLNTNPYISDMIWRAKIVLNPKVWEYMLYVGLWKCTKPAISTCKRLCVWIVLYSFYTPICLIYVCVESVPLFYVLVQQYDWLIRRCKNSSCRSTGIICDVGALILILFASTTYVVKIFDTFRCLTEVIGYTFLGLVVNADHIGPVAIFVAIIFGNIVGVITNFYDGYSVLFGQVMGVEEDEDKEEVDGASFVSPPQTDEEHGRDNSKTTEDGQDNSIKTEDAAVELQLVPAGRDANQQAAACEEKKQLIVNCNAKGISTLKLKLFWLIVEKYRPVRVQVAKTFFQLLLIAFCSAIFIYILIEIESLSSLSSTVKLFSVVIIGGLIPTVRRAFKSPATKECHKKARKEEIKFDLLYYRRNGKLRTTEAQSTEGFNHLSLFDGLKEILLSHEENNQGGHWSSHGPITEPHNQNGTVYGTQRRIIHIV